MLVMKRVWFTIVKKQSSVHYAAFILMSMVCASRILGLLRDRLLASRFTPEELGIYFAAFRLPNLLFELLVMGALTSAFIPVFTKYISNNKEQEAWHIAAALITFCVSVLSIIAIPFLLFTSQISKFIAPGFSTLQINQMAQFTRFMIIFQVFPLLVGNFFTGILQSYNLFLIPALAPVVYNIGIIIGIIVLTPIFGLWAPVIGVGIGAILFLCIQMPPLFFAGYRHRWTFDIHHKGVREVLRLMAPRTIGLAVSQIDTTVDLVLATLLGARMVTIFNFAQHLQQLPVGLFGVTVAQAAFPILSQASVKNEKTRFNETIISSVNQILFFMFPISVLFIVLRIPIVRLVFGASRFDWHATVLTGMTLSTFSLSLAAQAVSHVFTRGFYALYDSKTPVIIGIITILLNAVFSIIAISVFRLPIWALGLSTSIASIVNSIILIVVFCRKIPEFSATTSIISGSKMLFASLIMGVALYIPLKLFDQLIFDTTRTFGLILLTGVSGVIGFTCYFFLVWVMGVSEVKSFLVFIEKVRHPKVFLEPANEVVNNGAQQHPLS